jgi:hypothetical protein
MSKNYNKKHRIFKLFSQNLEWVKEHPSIKFEPDFSNGYICPLCFETFFEKDLDIKLKNHLTLEDMPPKSLGGKPIALTCKSCNNKSGHELDVHLLKTLLSIDVKSFLPNSKAETTFELNGNKVNGILEVDEKGTLKLDLQTNRSNPNQSSQFMKDMFPPRTIYNPLFYPDKMFDNAYQSPTFKMQFKENSNERRAEVALLRIAYLLAFATLGNGFLINGGLYKVREQILNPDKEILPKVFWLKVPFPKECEGVNIITLPRELQSYLVVFNLKTTSQSRQFAIVLPGPSTPSTKVYDFISKELCVGDGTTFCNATFEHIPHQNYFKKKEFAFAGNWFWQEYTKDDYKPRYKPEITT